MIPDRLRALLKHPVLRRVRALPRPARIGLIAAGTLLVLTALSPTTVSEAGISSLLSLGNVGAFAILAVGIVMIYRASKVLNLAHGAMVMFPPYVVLILTGGLPNGGEYVFSQRFFAAVIPAAAVGPLIATLLRRRLPRPARVGIGVLGAVATVVALMRVSEAGAPIPVAVAVGVLAGGALGYLVERVFVRTLRRQGPTAQTVGTVAALGLVVAVAASTKVFGSAAVNAVPLFPEGSRDIGASTIRYGEIGLFLLALAITALLIVLIQRTNLGLVMRGTAENRRAAALMGIDPDRVTAMTWIIGGALAGVSGILLASVTNLHPYVLSLQALPAFVAALLAGMASLPGAVVGAAVVGVTYSVFPTLGALEGVQGGPQLFLALMAVGAMVTRGQRIVGGDIRAESLTASGGGSGAGGMGGLAYAKRPLIVLGLIAFAVMPFLPFVKGSIVYYANTAAVYALVAGSLVILIGWVGQISLGHAALVGVGAYTTGWVSSGLGIPFPLSLPLAGAASAVVAAVLGVVAVRVRGLFLAVATLIFSWMGSEFLFRQEWFIKHFRLDATRIGREGAFPFFDFGDERTFYFVAWAIVAIGLLAAANLRDSKTGRAFFAVQGSEMAAASLGVDVSRYKVVAFALSGFLAGVGGNLFITHARTVGPDSFAFNFSLLFVAMAVVGGLRSLGGAVTAGILFAMLEEIQLDVAALSGYLEIVSAGLLTVVLLAYPGGLAGLGTSVARVLGRWSSLVRILGQIDRWLDTVLADLSWAWRTVSEKVRLRLQLPSFEVLPALALAPAAPATASLAPVADAPRAPTLATQAAPRPLPARREDRTPIVRAENVTVRFGGLTAVDDVTMEVREGEIVGLIGPNGAGKTVTFNSIAGIVTPTSGRITLHGADVTREPVHERARLGIARTFQVLQLFPALTVFQNLLVATHLHNQTSLLAHISASAPSLAAEREARERVHEVIRLVGLTEVMHGYPGDLPFGTLRMVEVARALVTDLRFIMLDEAASGLDDTETERLVEALLAVRDLGRTLLLIEHDVKMVMSVSDHVYVLDRGKLIAEGPPAAVQRDPAVIAAYLGTAPEEDA